MEGNAHVSQLRGCSLTYWLPFHSLPDRARKAGECKADAILERNREKSFFFHFPVTEAWCGSSLSLGREEGKIALLPSTSRAPWSPCPGLPHATGDVPGGCTPRAGSPTGASSAPRRHGQLQHTGAKGRGVRAWALLQHAGTGDERQMGVRGRRQVCAEMGRYRHRQTCPPAVPV